MYFCIVCCNVSFSISSFGDLILLSFFLDESAKGLLILLIFSKNQLLVLLIFTIVYLISFSFISAWIFMVSFLLLIFFSSVVLLLFPVVLGVKLGCLFEVFLVS